MKIKAVLFVIGALPMGLLGCASGSPQTAGKARAPQSVSQRLMSEGEWSGACRKFVDQGGHDIQNGSARSFQNTYLFLGESVLWSVRSFQDEHCLSPVEINKFTLVCDADPIVSNAHCVQSEWEVWQGNSWQSQPVDREEPVRYLYSLELLDEEKARLETKADREDQRTEMLTRKMDNP